MIEIMKLTRYDHAPVVSFGGRYDRGIDVRDLVKLA